MRAVLLSCILSIPLFAQVDRQLELARAWERDGQLEKALNVYQSLYATDSLNSDVISGLKNIYRTLGYHDARRSVILKQLQRDSLNIPLRVELADTWYRQKAMEEGKKEVARILGMKDATIPVYRLVASMLIENRQLDEVESIYRKARLLFKDETLFVLDMARLHAYRGDYYHATQELIRFVGGQSDLSYLESQISQFPDTEKENTDVIRAIMEYLREHPADIPMYRMLLRVQIRSNQYDEAFELAKALDERLKRQGVEVLNFADQARGAGQFAAATKGYQYFLQRYPQSPQAELGLAICFESTAEGQSSRAQGADSLVSEKLLFDEAIRRYDEVIKKYPETEWSAEALVRAGGLYLDRYFDVDEALRYYRRVAREFTRSGFRFEAWLKAAECLVIQNKLTEAQQELNELVQQGVREPRALEEARFRLAELQFYMGNLDTAADLLKPLIMQKSGRMVNDALELALVIQENRKSRDDLMVYAKVKRMTFQRRYSEAVELIDELLRNRSQSSLADDACLLRAVILQKQKRYSEALQTLDYLTTAFGKSPLSDKAALLKGELASVVKDYAAAIRYYKELLTNYPSSIYAAEARKRLRDLEGKVKRSS